MRHFFLLPFLSACSGAAFTVADTSTNPDPFVETASPFPATLPEASAPEVAPAPLPSYDDAIPPSPQGDGASSAVEAAPDAGASEAAAPPGDEPAPACITSSPGSVSYTLGTSHFACTALAGQYCLWWPAGRNLNALPFPSACACNETCDCLMRHADRCPSSWPVTSCTVQPDGSLVLQCGN